MRLVKPRPTKPRLQYCNAISYPDEHGCLRQPCSPCFFRIFKEQPKNKTQCEGRALHAAFPGTTESGGANRDRTGDLLLAKQALSQLSYGPLKRGQTTFFTSRGFEKRGLSLFSGGRRLVGLDGFEPSTPALSRRCSNQLSYRPGCTKHQSACI